MKYSLEDWLEDYGWYCELIQRLLKQGAPKGSQNAPFRDYFLRKYHNEPGVSFHRARLAAGLSWFDRHFREIDFAPLAVICEDKAIVTKAFIMALWRYYAQCPNEHLADDPPVLEIATAARENETILKKPRDSS